MQEMQGRNKWGKVTKNKAAVPLVDFRLTEQPQPSMRSVVGGRGPG